MCEAENRAVHSHNRDELRLENAAILDELQNYM